MTTMRSTNFHKSRKGNALHVGEDLIIKIDNDPVYIIGRLFRRGMLRSKLIQIEQTGTKQNPQNDSIIFEMKERVQGKMVPMKPGKYTVSNYAYFTGIGGKRWKDKFEVV